MAIVLTCACGKKLTVHGKKAGTRLRCPQCSKPVDVPGGPQGAAAAAPARPGAGWSPGTKSAAGAPKPGSAAPPTGAPSIKFACVCGKRLGVPVHLAGRRVKCPACGVVAAVPAAPAEEIPRAEFAAPQPYVAGLPAQAPGPAPGAPRRSAGISDRDLTHEAHLRAISFWQRVGGILVTLLGLLLVLGIGLLAGEARRADLGRTGGFLAGLAVILGVVAIGGGVLSYLLGHFLWHYHNWARLTLAVFACLGLLGSLSGLRAGAGGILSAASGLLWNGGILWAILSSRAAEICSPDYRRQVAATRDVKPAWFASPFFYGPFILAALNLAIGFLHGSKAQDF